ncbi:unnamed protein product [Rotaria socialis]|uniref:Reverse transcriptase domain-containing protein n=1 Tax=Rotaria socialis TaxID=392032 RepID=A0A818VNY2_9BILA|nr:unnamed protein product [Rotaria socialis]CAF4416771.1 unnamed protein product [Rotaria socialis]CAF4453873.1 unnamed protein product [Rotaria socialis]CAF4742539.1 unnamed protein product [Rotaria socialis]
MGSTTVNINKINNQRRQQQNTIQRTKLHRRRCHGNRKLRRFKKKCRQRGMNDEEIQRLIQDRQQQQQPPRREENDIQMKETNDIVLRQSKNVTRKTSTTKRKLKKKIKKCKKLKVASTKFNRRLPMYLKKEPNILMQSVRLHLQQKLTNKKHQQFIYQRLPLLDQQYRLGQYRFLWQTYLTLGSLSKFWPMCIQKKIKSTNNELSVQYIEQRLNKLEKEYRECINELKKQAELCPIKLGPFDILNQKLKEFVRLQRTRFTEKLNAQLTRYKNYIHENELYKSLLSHIHTDEQKSTIDQLIFIRERQLEIFENYLRLETRVSMECLPRQLNRIENIFRSIQYRTHLRDFLSIEYQQKRFKLIQETKRHFLNIYLHSYEIQYQQRENEYQQLFKEFVSKNNLSNNESILLEGFHRYMNYRIDRLKQIIYYEQIPIFQKKLRHQRQRLKRKRKFLKQVQVSPHVILDLRRHPFTTNELKYLSRGPSYIRPNQSTLRPIKQRDKQIKKEIDEMLNKIKNTLVNATRDGYPSIPKTTTMYKSYEDRLRTCLTLEYMKPLPLMNQLRARRELKLIKSIRRKLKKHKLILRQTDKSGVFHIGHLRDYERKAYLYRTTTGAYEELSTNPLNDIFHRVTNLLNQLRSQNRIRERQKSKLIPIQNKTELAYMYFLPKSHKEGTPLRPIINTIHAATTQISKFLDQSLRPLFDRYVRSTTIVDGVDLFHRLDVYIKNGYFKSSTLFVTFDITNLYTMLPQEESLEILAEFLREHGCQQIDGVSIETIIELARLVLKENVFVYDGKFYRQIIGGAMGSPFTLTLANIFMWKWERQTILSKLPSHELYGRYIDDVIFTSNESETTIKEWLDFANQFHPNIKLTYTIGQCLPFLDVLIENRNATLYSSVYHKPAAEPTILSFLSDHPRHVFRNVIQTALMRAIRYSSTFEAFNIERRRITYPSVYINTQFQQFFLKYLPTFSSILPFIDNEEQFVILRKKLLTQPSLKQILFDKSVATVDHIIKDQCIKNDGETTNDKDNKFHKKIFIHSLYEGRFRNMQRQIHEIHDSFFNNTIYQDIRLIVGHRNNPNIEFELTRKRPSSSLLKNQPFQKKQKLTESTTTTA